MAMDRELVLGVLKTEREAAKAYSFEQIGYERAYCYDRYYGKPLGDEIEGQSQVLSQEVAEAIDAATPQMVEMFVASDRAVECKPRGAEDVDAAEQATDVCNYVFYTQNNGYKLVHDGIKDGLLQKTGAYIWFWEPPRLMVEEYEGLSDQELMILAQDPEAELRAHSQTPDGKHSVQLGRKKGAGRVRIRSIPPEELLISPRATDLDVYDMPYIGYAPLLSRSDLLELGFDPAQVDELTPGDDLLSTDQASIARRERENTLKDRVKESIDKATDRFRYYHEYIRIDEDGDGIAELRCICSVGETILYDKPTDHIAMSVWTPKIMPHEPIGISMGDDVADQQVLATVLWRQALNALYLANAPRMYVDENAKTENTLDDVLNVRSGGVIRGRGPAAVTPIQVPFAARDAYQMLEYVKQEVESRTGIPRYIQGFDPDSLNQTKGGMQILQDNAQVRLKMYARNFAELALKPLFKGVLYLLSKNQREALTIRLRNKFVPIDPRVWANEYDMTINVGLGTGAKDQQLMHLQSLGMDLQTVGASPFGGQLLDAKKIYNFIQKKAELCGFKDVTQFLNDPDNTQPPPPQPPLPLQVEKMKQDGETARTQMKVQGEGQKAQVQGAVDAQKAQHQAQLDTQERQATLYMDQVRMQMEQQLEIFKAQLKHAADVQAAHLNAAVRASQPPPHRPQ